MADIRDVSLAERRAKTSAIMGIYFWIPFVSIGGMVCGTRGLCLSEPHTRARRLALLGCLLALLGILWTALLIIYFMVPGGLI